MAVAGYLCQKREKHDKAKQKRDSKKKIDRTNTKIANLELERNQAVSKLKALEELVEKLPEIFESKFTQWLTPVLERQRVLLKENTRLQARSTS